MSVSEGSYNAVTWLLDRNIEEGRGSKLAFDDTVSRLTYGELVRETRRVANMLRRLGVRREERVAMIMLDTVDFPIVFLGAIRAGIVPVPLNTLLTADQYAYILADCRARVLFVSEALYPMIHRFLPVLYQAQHLVEHWESIGASFLLPDNCSLACICASAGCNDISEASHGAPEQGTTEVEGWLWRDPYCRFGQYSSFFAILCLSAGRVAVQNCMIAYAHEVKRDKRAQ